MDFVTLACPTCGSRLQVTNDLERFACSYCGNEHVVRRTGGIVALDPVTEDIRRVRIGVDKTASELAIKRLKNEIPQLEQTVLQNREKFLRIDDYVITLLDSIRPKRPWWKLTPGPHELAPTLQIGELHELKRLLQHNIEVFTSSGALEKKFIGFEKHLRQLDLLQEILDMEEQLTRKRAEMDEHERIVSS